MEKELFIERKEYHDALEKRIRSLKDGYRHNLAILGDELSGKTSIVFNLLEGFCDNKILITYLENRPETFDTFAKRFIGSLLYSFLSNSGIPLKQDINFLLDKSRRYIPATCEKIERILASLKKHKKTNIFSDLLSLTESINQETGKFCVIIFDEFQNLECLGIKTLYKEWSKLLIVQKNTLYVVISSLKHKALSILSKDLSLLFGNFETLIVDQFSPSLSELYLKKRMANLKLEQGIIDFIVHFTGGYPFYLKVFSDALLDSKDADIITIIENMVFSPAGILNQRFSSYIKRFLDCPHSQEFIAILHLVANGNNKLKEISHHLHKNKNEAASRISRLLELGAITKNADFLKINDRIFGFWLKFVYQEKMQSLTFDSKNQQETFHRNIENLIKDFLDHAQKPISERLTELMRLFEDDTIQIEAKKLKLTQFREIKPLQFNKGNLKDGLLGRSNDSLWIMAFKENQLTEDDIAEFAKECKKYRHNLQKKIIIAFDEIEPNAKLRALEEKILTWDVNNLNQILDLFSKPWVIA